VSIYLDSALISDAQTAVRFGWVQGITTNPILLAKSPLSPIETLKELVHLTPGPVFYQLTAETVGDMMSEAHRAKDLLGEQLVLKIPPTEAGFTVTTELSSSISCAITAIYSPTQALVAEACGARFAILYYNRAMRLMPESADQMVAETVSVLLGSRTEVVAASIKSAQEVVAVCRIGIHHLTVSLEVLKEMMQNKLSQSAVEEFKRDGKGIFSA
jgi:transaldolase